MAAQAAGALVWLTHHRNSRRGLLSKVRLMAVLVACDLHRDKRQNSLKKRACKDHKTRRSFSANADICHKKHRRPVYAHCNAVYGRASRRPQSAGGI